MTSGRPTVQLDVVADVPPLADSTFALPAPGESLDSAADLATPEALPAPAVADEDLTGALEAVLLVVDTPVTVAALAAALDRPLAQILSLVEGLADDYTARGSGIELRFFGGGWRFYTRDRFAPVVERFVLDGQQGRLSRAALETLAVIAYRQPVSRARISGVRGVNVDGVIRTLTARGMIQETGADADTGGILYSTTEMFLERMGLSSLEELPSLGPLLPDIDSLDDV